METFTDSEIRAVCEALGYVWTDLRHNRLIRFRLQNIVALVPDIGGIDSIKDEIENAVGQVQLTKRDYFNELELGDAQSSPTGNGSVSYTQSRTPADMKEAAYQRALGRLSRLLDLPVFLEAAKTIDG